MWGGKEFHIFGAEIQKAWEPNERLCRGTESKWLADERVDLVVLWYCKRSATYGGWPVCNALKVKVASLNLIRHSIGSQWSCLSVNYRILLSSPPLTSPCVTRSLSTNWKKNKYERYYWTQKAPACLLILVCHYGKPRMCINIHHYAPPIECSITHRAATSVAAAVRFSVSEVPIDNVKNFANCSLITH